jgi:hypothetical protein
LFSILFRASLRFGIRHDSLGGRLVEVQNAKNCQHDERVAEMTKPYMKALQRAYDEE